MMTKLKGIILSCVIVLAMVFATGCTVSAYDLAVKNGFNGTEQEWLASLKGEDGTSVNIKDIYHEAQDSGFEGTYLEFIKEYLTFEEGQDNTASIAVAMRSAVVVTCEFNRTSYFGGQQEYSQLGAGVIYQLDKSSGTAYIITNYHVVYGSQSAAVSSNITVTPYGGSPIKATYVGGTAQYDIAVLKSQDAYFSSNFADSVIVSGPNDVSIGQTAIAIGNPEGQGLSVTQGIISVESEYIEMSGIEVSSQSVFMRVIRVDAAVNSGNSGGGLFDAHGQLIGIVNAKSADSSNENLSYAIPSSIACGVADNIIKNGKFSKATVGITLGNADSRTFIENGLVRITETVTIDQVDGAALGKLEVGDIIKSVTVNGKTTEVIRMFNVIDAVLAATPGDTIKFQIERGGSAVTVTVTCA